MKNAVMSLLLLLMTSACDNKATAVDEEIESHPAEKQYEKGKIDSHGRE